MDVADLALQLKYELATHGRQCNSWSAWFRDIIGVDEAPTEDELAADEVGGEASQ